MTVSPLLGISQVAPGQSNKEVTENNATAALEAAANATLTITFSGSNVTLTTAQFASAIRFVITGAASSLSLKIPLLSAAGNAYTRQFTVTNNCAYTMTIAPASGGGTTQTIATGISSLLYFDGTNITTISSSTSAIGITVKNSTTVIDSSATVMTFDSALFTVTDTVAGSVLVSSATGMIPAVGGIVLTTGTILTTATLSSNLTLSGSTLSINPITAGLVSSNGTLLISTVLGGNLAYSGGTLSLSGVELTANKGAANGYAGLDSSGLVPFAQLPAALSEAIYFAGSWNANTNTTTLSTSLASGTGTPGQMFKVTTAGTTTLDGVSVWNVGDQAVFSGISNTWVKFDGIATEVTSVVGRTGAVLISTSDVSGLNTIASQTVPSAGFILSNGTILTTATLGANLTLTGSTISFSPPSIGLVWSNGTTVAPATIGSNLTLNAGGTLDAVTPAYEPKFGFNTSPTGGQLLFGDYITRNVSFLGNFAGSRFRCNVAPTSNWTATINKNGATIGTIFVGAASNTGTITTTSGLPVSLVATDYLEVFAPVSADATMSQGYATFVGTR